jgi:hypothetical protein
MKAPRLTIIAIAAVTALAVGACSDDGDSDESPGATSTAGPPVTAQDDGISQDEAIAIAREAYRDEDPDFDFEDKFDFVSETATSYDISFPKREPEGPGGEPHVVIERATGDVTEIYFTR